MKFRVDAVAFRSLLRRVMWAGDSESSRYALGSVRLELSDGTLTAVATDGRRLATATATAIGDDCEVMMSLADCRAMSKRIGKSAGVMRFKTLERVRVCKHTKQKDGSVSVTYDTDRTGWVAMWCQAAGKRGDRNRTASGLQVEGRFPRWRDAIPPEERSLTTLTAKTADGFLAGLPDPEYRGIDMVCNGSVIGKRDPSHFNVERFGPDVAVTFDAEYLRDWLTACPEKVPVRMGIESEHDAIRCDCGPMTYVFMPLTTDRR